jgi:hypothetical protein
MAKRFGTTTEILNMNNAGVFVAIGVSINADMGIEYC